MAAGLAASTSTAQALSFSAQEPTARDILCPSASETYINQPSVSCPSLIHNHPTLLLTMPDIFVRSFTHLKDKPKADQALKLLQRIASLVKPIMRKHGWTLPVLSEFYPEEPNLLGKSFNLCGVDLTYNSSPASHRSQ